MVLGVVLRAEVVCLLGGGAVVCRVGWFVGQAFDGGFGLGGLDCGFVDGVWYLM